MNKKLDVMKGVFGVLIFLSVLSLNAQDLRTFSLVGSVTDKVDGEPILDFIIDVYEKNEIIKTVAAEKKGKFEVEVYGNSEYTIEIYKEGYYPKRVVFNTNVPSDVKKLADLKFETELLRTSDYEDLESVDAFSTSIFDFPYVIFEYDKKLEDFNYRKAYTDHIKAKYEEVADLR